MGGRLPKRRNAAAKALGTPKYRVRVIPNKKRKAAKKRWRGDERER